MLGQKWDESQIVGTVPSKLGWLATMLLHYIGFLFQVVFRSGWLATMLLHYIGFLFQVVFSTLLGSHLLTYMYVPEGSNERWIAIMA